MMNENTLIQHRLNNYYLIPHYMFYMKYHKESMCYQFSIHQYNIMRYIDYFIYGNIMICQLSNMKYNQNMIPLYKLHMKYGMGRTIRIHLSINQYHIQKIYIIFIKYYKQDSNHLYHMLNIHHFNYQNMLHMYYDIINILFQICISYHNMEECMRTYLVQNSFHIKDHIVNIFLKDIQYIPQYYNTKRMN